MAWIWNLCLTNMKQRGIRTFLTILGVVIGVISIVSLLAIGIGVKNEIFSTVENAESITEITVYGVNEGKRKDRMITDRKVKEFSELEHVEVVYPRLTINGLSLYGNYMGYASLMGVPASYLEEKKLAAGEFPSQDGRKPEIIMGKYALDLFFNIATNSSYTEVYKEDKEKLNLTGENLEIQFDMMTEGAQSYRLKVCGMAEEVSYDMYCNLDVLKKYLKQIKSDGVIPGQPVDDNGQNYNEWIYDSVIVKVEDADYVEDVVKKLQDLGYQVENNKEMLDTMQRTVKIVQIVLGGVGMIALLVAVIGIGNTMTTAVYDRINEIGILKVLGCDPDELLYLFLLESGILGGIGGLTGILLSVGITEIGINKIAVKMLELPKGTDLAVIPMWLAIVAFVFAIVLGLLAGYFPARWAAKLRPIEAVRK